MQTSFLIAQSPHLIFHAYAHQIGIQYFGIHLESKNCDGEKKDIGEIYDI